MTELLQKGNLSHGFFLVRREGTIVVIEAICDRWHCYESGKESWTLIGRDWFIWYGATGWIRTLAVEGQASLRLHAESIE